MSLWLPGGVSEWNLCPIIAIIPTCLLRVRFSQQMYMEQSESKHTNLEVAWESHGDKCTGEKTNKAKEEVDIWSRRVS